MDIINSTRPAPFAAVINTVVANIFGNTFSYVVAAYKAKRTRIALQNLSARQLQDIGLTRGDIPQASRQPIFLR